MKTMDLPDTLNIATVTELYPRLNAALEVGEAITLRAEVVGRVDAAGVQLLLAFVREAQARQVEVTITPEGSPVHEAIRDLGLGESMASAISS